MTPMMNMFLRFVLALVLFAVLAEFALADTRPAAAARADAQRQASNQPSPALVPPG